MLVLETVERIRSEVAVVPEVVLLVRLLVLLVCCSCGELDGWYHELELRLALHPAASTGGAGVWSTRVVAVAVVLRHVIRMSTEVIVRRARDWLPHPLLRCFPH